MPWTAPEVNLRPKHKALLENIVTSRTVRSDHRQRAKLMLLFDEGISNAQAGKAVGLKTRQAGTWRNRWLLNQAKLVEVETKGHAKPNGLRNAIEEVLSDLPRSGAPPTFSAEQMSKILAVACEAPQQSDIPLSHWSLPALREEVIKRKIVDNISTSKLQVFLKSGRVKATQGRGVAPYPRGTSGL